MRYNILGLFNQVNNIKSMPKVNLVIRIDEELKKSLAMEAEKQSRTSSNLAEIIIRAYLESINQNNEQCTSPHTTTANHS